METHQSSSNPQNVECKPKTPTRIQVIKFAIGIVIGISIYLIVQLIF